MEKKILVSVVVVVVVVLGVSLAYMSEIPDSDPLTIITIRWPSFGFLHVAEQKGFFEKNNVNVEIILIEENPHQDDLSYIEGTADASMEVFSNIILIDSNFIDSQLVYVSDESTTSDFFVSKYENISDLKGKSIGIFDRGGFSYLFVTKLLENNGLSEKDVTLIEIDFDDIVDEINSGMIDAGHTWNGYNKVNAENSNLHIVGYASDTPGIINDSIMFKKATIIQRHDDVLNFLKSFSEAQNYCELNYNECVDIISQKYGWDKLSVSDGLTSVNIMNLDENTLMLQDQGPLFDSGNFIIKKLRQNNFISHSSEIEDVINSDFVTELVELQNP
jgi:NitT/TauT family transport system substrate-binding protein